MDQETRRRVKASYLSGAVRQALEKAFPSDLTDAILETLRRGLA